MFSKVNHKFTINFSIINAITGETRELPKALKAIAVKYNYSTNFTTLYVLSLSVTEEERRYIVKNKIYASLNISRYTVDQTIGQNQESSTTTPTIDKEICNLLLLPYDKVKVYSNPNASDISDEQNKENAEQQKVSYELTCIPKEQVDYNNKIINDCYANANINEIMINILSNNYKNKIYYEESENTTRYDSFLIPPMSLTQVVQYIHNNFSLYKNVANLFFDDNKLFVYDIDNSDRKFNNTFNIEIKKNEDNSDKTLYQSAQIDEDENIKTYMENIPLTVSSDDVFNNTIGGTTEYSSYDDNFNLVSRKYNNNDTEKVRYFWNEDKFKNFETKKLRTIHQFATITEYNLDPSIILPDTKIMISGSDLSEVNGIYALICKDVFYATTDYTNYTESIILTLGKN